MLRKYEAMFILKPDLDEQKVNSLSKQITETIVKAEGKVGASEVWSGKRKFCFPIKKFSEGMYYRVDFVIESSRIDSLKQGYKLNEDILRLMINSLEK